MMPIITSILTGLCCSAVSAAGAASTSSSVAAWPTIEYAYEIWDWVADYRDFDRFRARVAEAREIGFNTIEISVPWKNVQPKRDGVLEWTETDRRINHVLATGLALRVRINHSYAHPWPDWAKPELSTRHDGKQPTAFMTIFDDELNRLQDRITRAVAARYRGG